VFHRPLVACCVIPYFSRMKIDLPPLNKLMDISQQRLQELKNSEMQDPDEEKSNDAEPLPDD
jgi:hypothetical protein